MRVRHDIYSALLLGLVLLGLGCGGTMNTGTAKKPVNNKPAADGSCPTGQSLCGSAVFAICVDLQSDSSHCGTCDQACSPGIACQAGVCQQTVCTGTAVPLSGQPTISVNGTAPAVPPQAYFTAKELLADVNGDGRLDRVEAISNLGVCSACSNNRSEFLVSLGQPDGTFAPPDTYQASASISELFALDVNSDGMSDLYVVSSTYSNGTTAPYHVELWLGQKDGHLQRSNTAGISVEGMSGWGFEVAMGDLSGDGWPDLVMEAPDANLEASPKISVYLSDSTGALHLSQTFVAWAGRTFVRDFNGDGSPDLVLTWSTMQILYNRGDGTFEQPLDCALAIGNGAWGENDVVLEDFNRDGRTDLATGRGNSVGVMLGLGGCGFAPISYYDIPGTSVGWLRAADMNGDGILDLVSIGAATGVDPNDPKSMVYITTDNLLAVLLGNRDGTFHLQETVISLGPSWISDVAIGEVSGDRRPDIVVASAGASATQISTWENTCQ